MLQESPAHGRWFLGSFRSGGSCFARRSSAWPLLPAGSQPARHGPLQGRCLEKASPTHISHNSQGDCLFHAIAQGLTEYGEVGSSGTPRSYRQLRAFVTGTFKKYPTEYGELWANQGRIDPQAKMQSEEASFDRYVQEIATPGTWSGALELSAYCENTATEAWVVSGLRAAELKGWLRVQLKGVSAHSLLPRYGRRPRVGTRGCTLERVYFFEGFAV